MNGSHDASEWHTECDFKGLITGNKWKFTYFKMCRKIWSSVWLMFDDTLHVLTGFFLIYMCVWVCYLRQQGGDDVKRGLVDGLILQWRGKCHVHQSSDFLQHHVPAAWVIQHLAVLVNLFLLTGWRRVLKKKKVIPFTHMNIYLHAFYASWAHK